MGADSTRLVCPLFPGEDGGSTPTSALQLNIVRVTPDTARDLNLEWHSRMPEIGCWSMCQPCFAAEYQGRYYAAAMWSYPIAANRIRDGENCLELRRLAIAPDAPRNTASRMLRIMRLIISREFKHVKRLLSYQDTEVHKGTIYLAAGWKPVCQTKWQTWAVHSRRPGGKYENTSSAKIRWEINLRD